MEFEDGGDVRFAIGPKTPVMVQEVNLQKTVWRRFRDKLSGFAAGLVKPLVTIDKSNLKEIDRT